MTALLIRVQKVLNACAAHQENRELPSGFCWLLISDLTRRAPCGEKNIHQGQSQELIYITMLEKGWHNLYKGSMVDGLSTEPLFILKKKSPIACFNTPNTT